MIICIQNLVKLCPLVFKISSGNEIQTCINGYYSVANVPKIVVYNPNLDVININMYTNLVKLCPFILKILSRNEIVTSIKGRNSAANLRKMTL